MDPTSAVLEDNSSPGGATTAVRALRILVVDDSEAIRAFMRAKLKIIASERYELHLDTAPSGEDAIASCALQPYDLVFMDVVMPGMGGIEACRQIKAAHQVAVAMVSSLRGPEDQKAAYEAGCDTYLSKPVKDADLQEVVRQAVEGRVLAR